MSNWLPTGAPQDSSTRNVMCTLSKEQQSVVYTLPYGQQSWVWRARQGELDGCDEMGGNGLAKVCSGGDVREYSGFFLLAVVDCTLEPQGLISVENSAL